MSRTIDFSGRTALVTGAASGIGAATAAWLAQHGAGRLLLEGGKQDISEGDF